MTSGRAMQVAGSLKMKNKQQPGPLAHGILPRYMAAGSWHASLSSEGKDTRKKGQK